MRERSLASAPGEEPFDDLTVELSDRKLQGLSDDMKDKLREIGRVDPTQYKIEHFKWEGLREEDDWFVENAAEMQERILGIQDCTESLMTYADPIPAPGGYMKGIEHFNSLMKFKLHDVVRAIHSKKMHYVPKVQSAMNQSQGMKFNAHFPDMDPAIGGTKRLSPQAWQKL